MRDRDGRRSASVGARGEAREPRRAHRQGARARRGLGPTSTSSSGTTSRTSAARSRRAIPGVVAVYGSQDLDEREASIADFADGEIARLAAKPVMLGSGCNLQRHCAWAIFAGVGFKFNDFIQAIHRIYRFLQTREVVIDIVYAESEAAVVKELEEKWARYDAMMARMSEIIREYGLHSLGARSAQAHDRRRAREVAAARAGARQRRHASRRRRRWSARPTRSG
jgi:hypothetical protein